MTERFKFDASISHFTDTTTNKTYCEYNLDEVVDLLNEQDQRIQELEEENQKLRELLFDPRRITNEVKEE